MLLPTNLACTVAESVCLNTFEMCRAVLNYFRKSTARRRCVALSAAKIHLARRSAIKVEGHSEKHRG